jgi:peptidoglycan/LPS O-acetylase OafA/YrhL
MKERIGALDGWRGLAILLVLVDHAAEMSRTPWIHKVTRTGATGVGIFFALSGFLITSLLLSEQQKRGRVRLGGFYLRRLFRIVPSVLVFIAVLACLRAAGVLPIPNLELLSPIFLFRNYIGGNWGVGWYTGHFWSLTVEEHFYLIWPLLLLATRANLKVLAGLAIAVAGWRAVSLHYQLLPGPWAPGRTDIRIDSLLWGCILAIVCTRPELREKLKRGLTGWVMLALVAVDVASNIRNGQHDYSFFEPIILALLVVWPVLHPASALRRFLDHPVLGFFGRISYSLYIWQQLWLLMPGVPMPFPRLQTFPVNIVMALACAVVCYYTVEEPFIRLGRRVAALAAPQTAHPSTDSQPIHAFPKTYVLSPDAE